MKKESQKLMTTGDQQAALDLSASQDKVNATINNEINKQQVDKENKLKAQELVEGNKEQEKNNSANREANANLTNAQAAIQWQTAA